MQMTFETLYDKILGCWTGKCIGGTLGAPFECQRRVIPLEFYTQDLSAGPVPNDDLDLQLVWLNAAEQYGRQVNAAVLGEYWLSFIIQNWSEYGTGKNNLRSGLVPPLSGAVDNPNRNSCGCFIRSELWACLAPGHPEIAVRYACEDGCVDHSHEGLYAEIFFAAIQSAAFSVHVTETLLDIGMSYIPSESAIAGAVRTARECFCSGMDWADARLRILTDFPGSFGALFISAHLPEPGIPVGPVGWDAPSNVGLTVLAWLYGEGDFGKSICLAAGAGEDTDCTAATLGAILGIISGHRNLPEKWKEPISDRIVTMCINHKDHRSGLAMDIPETLTALTQRVMRQLPAFLGPEFCDILDSTGLQVRLHALSDLYYQDTRISWVTSDSFAERLAALPWTVSYESVIFKACLNYGRSPVIQAGTSLSMILTLENKDVAQHWAEISWHLPEGWRVTPGKKTCTSLSHRLIGRSTVPFCLEIPEVLDESRYELILKVSLRGRPSTLLIPVVLLHGNAVWQD